MPHHEPAPHAPGRQEPTAQDATPPQSAPRRSAPDVAAADRALPLSTSDEGHASLRHGRQPWLHQLAIVVDGNITALSASDGQIDGTGASGVFVDDRRVVSVLEVRLGAEGQSHIASRAAGPSAEFWSAARALGEAGVDPTVEVRRRRELRRGGGLRETITVVSRASTTVRATLHVAVGGDGADIGEVKAGSAGGGLLPAAVAGPVLSWQDDRHRTTVRFTPAPTRLRAGTDAVTPAGPAPRRAGGGRASFDLDLGPDEEVTAVLDIDTTRVRRSDFDAESGSDAAGWADVTVRADDPRLAPAISTSLTDLQHLLLRDPQNLDDVFAAAGSPWYLTLFGRDSLWTARLMLPFGTDLARGTLRALARRQGTVVDVQRAEAPGKIPHEVRRSAYEGGLPPLYYGTVDATALWVCLLHDAWRWGMAREHVTELMPSLRAAVRWLVRDAVPDADGLLKYLDSTGVGLSNQGWKDSHDSMRWRDGTVATAPIALLEAQAYAVEAAGSAAALYEAWGEKGAAELRQWARELAERVRARYWVPGTAGHAESYLAMALDGDGKAVDGIGSNMGHALGTGLLDDAEGAAVARTLVSPLMLGRYGIHTLATDNGGFNPIGYHTGSVWTHDTAICAWGLHRQGRQSEAVEVARTLLVSAEAFAYRWPELYAGEGVLGGPAPYPASCRPQAWSAASAAVLVSVALGLEPDAPAGRLTLRGARPAPYGRLELTGLRFAGQPFGIRSEPDGTLAVTGSLSGVVVDVG